MSPGDFEDQIKAGIESSDYLVLVMTPAALRSPWVEKEWRYARENGRCIVPIKPTFESPQTGDELERCARRCRSGCRRSRPTTSIATGSGSSRCCHAPCQATRAPFLAANLPANFVHRQRVQSGIVLDAVLDAGHRNPSGRTVVLHGTGGFGKTTLALSVCHDPDVFAACDGGILWVTLGEQPSSRRPSSNGSTPR